jgi:DNA-binding NtrC family response regulator
VTEKPLVLVVEDESILATTLEAHLTDDGFEVKLAGSGVAGQSAIETDASHLACLVTDIRLGKGPNGWDLARLARELNPALPVVYMTGDSGADWAAQGVPNSLVLAKPFALAQLTTAVAQLLNATPL